MNPLSHHEIMALVGPYTRAGCALDLAASDRAARRLRFKTVAHTAPVGDAAGGAPPHPQGPDLGSPAAQHPTLLETLQLDNPATGGWRLQRTLALPSGCSATLTGHGPDPTALLQAVQAVPLQRQVRPVSGHWLALSHTVVPDSGRLTLTDAQARIGPAQLAMTVSRVKGIPAELSWNLPVGPPAHPGAATQDRSAALPALDQPAEPPEDLLAVLGLPWSRLKRAPHAGSAGLSVWRAHLSLRGFDAERTRDAEAKFERSVQHLAATLAEPPARFHARHKRARWFVVLRRLTPLLAALGLIAAAALVPQLELGPDSVWRMLIFNSPPLLLVWLFSMREMPTVEIPPWPRPSPAHRWLGGPAHGPGPPVEDVCKPVAGRVHHPMLETPSTSAHEAPQA